MTHDIDVHAKMRELALELERLGVPAAEIADGFMVTGTALDTQFFGAAHTAQLLEIAAAKLRSVAGALDRGERIGRH
jgi:hypothetical protein